MKTTLLALITGLSLTACAMTTEYVPTKGQSEAQFNRDKSECLQVASKYYGVTNNDLTQSDSYVVCLKSKGYDVKSKF
jgi:hypothetical protein